jgi:hypothetical protein
MHMQRIVVMNVMVEVQARPFTALYLLIVSVKSCHAVSFSKENN